MTRKVFPQHEEIKNLRKSECWSQDWVAQAADISKRTYQRIEGGEGCSIETLKSIASVFEVNFKALLPVPAAIEELERKNLWSSRFMILIVKHLEIGNYRIYDSLIRLTTIILFGFLLYIVFPSAGWFSDVFNFDSMGIHNIGITVAEVSGSLVGAVLLGMIVFKLLEFTIVYCNLMVSKKLHLKDSI